MGRCVFVGRHRPKMGRFREIDMRLKTTEAKVRHCLINYPATRADDCKLIGTVYALFYDVDPGTPFVEILTKISNRRLPNFESIRRTRQKIQQTDESLRAEKAIEDERISIQQEYIEYALSDR